MFGVKVSFNAEIIDRRRQVAAKFVELLDECQRLGLVVCLQRLAQAQDVFVAQNIGAWVDCLHRFLRRSGQCPKQPQHHQQ